MGGKMYRGKPCMKCGGHKMYQPGGKVCHDAIGNIIPCPGQEMTNTSDNSQWAQTQQPAPQAPSANPLDLVHESDTPNSFTAHSMRQTKNGWRINDQPHGEDKMDPFFAIQGATTGLEWLSGRVERNRQNRYMYDQFNNLNQMNPMPTNDYQPNPFSLYSRYGGKIKYAGGGLSRSQDYGSKSHPYPSVDSSDFAGGHRSYPIPTRADAIDALRLAHLHGREDVIAKVHAKYPNLQSGGVYSTQSQVEAANAEARRFAMSRGFPTGENTHVARRVGDPVVPYIDSSTGRPYVPGPVTPKAYNVPNDVQYSDIQSQQGQYYYNDPHTGNVVQVDPSVLNLPRFRKPVTQVNSDLMARMRRGGKYRNIKDIDHDMMAGGGKWLQGAINPAHKGWCTPLSNPHCTGHRRAFALMMKKKHGFN